MTDLLITETGGDRRNDIVVTSEGALTVFSQVPGGLFDLQVSVELPAGAKRTLAVSAGARPRFVVAFPRTAELGAVALGRSRAGHAPRRDRSLGAGNGYGRRQGWHGSLPLPPRGGKLSSLAAYEQLNERQYLERRIGGNLAVRVSVATARPAVEGSTPTLVVAARESRENVVSVFSYALGPGANLPVSGSWPRSGTPSATSSGSGRKTWTGTGGWDLILGLRRPTRRLAVLYGQERTANAADLVNVEGLAGADERGFEARDADGDGFCDLLACGEGRRSIDVAYGTGHRSFAASRAVVRTGQIQAFAAGPLTGECDLVVAEPRGTMTVFQLYLRETDETRPVSPAVAAVDRRPCAGCSAGDPDTASFA